MRRVLSIISFLLIPVLSLSALHTETVYFRAEIPEDHGVVFPENAMRLDKLVFELENGDLVTGEAISGMVLSSEDPVLEIDLLYYGNSAEPYSVSLSTQSAGWVSDDNTTFSIPVAVSFKEFFGNDGIYSNSTEDGRVDIHVPAAGARRGEKVAAMFISWETPLDTVPGDYSMELNLGLESAF